MAPITPIRHFCFGLAVTIDAPIDAASSCPSVVAAPAVWRTFGLGGAAAHSAGAGATTRDPS